MQINKEKQKLRKKAAALRSSVGAKDALSRKIAEKLFSLDVYLSCEKVFAYFSYSQEVQTEFIIEKALADGKKVALPRCESSGAMSFYYIESAAGLEKGTFKGILEPKANAEKAEADEKTLVIAKSRPKANVLDTFTLIICMLLIIIEIRNLSSFVFVLIVYFAARW